MAVHDQTWVSTPLVGFPFVTSKHRVPLFVETVAPPLEAVKFQVCRGAPVHVWIVTDEPSVVPPAVRQRPPLAPGVRWAGLLGGSWALAATARAAMAMSLENMVER